MNFGAMNLDGSPDDDQFRSRFIQLLINAALTQRAPVNNTQPIPRTLVQYWNNLDTLPDDVGRCLASWNETNVDGLKRTLFDDRAALAFIDANFGTKELVAFERCHHPAMRCDYFRICYIYVLGGVYVDADDVYSGTGLEKLYDNGNMKLQALCYDIPSGSMVPPSEFSVDDACRTDRIFYVNNNPIAAPPSHPLLARALERSTESLHRLSSLSDIQAITGPGNLSASLVGHCQERIVSGLDLDFEIIPDWDIIAPTVWDLSYRKDTRNWRLI